MRFRDVKLGDRVRMKAETGFRGRVGVVVEKKNPKYWNWPIIVVLFAVGSRPVVYGVTVTPRELEPVQEEAR
jgi:hypothetical protein